MQSKISVLMGIYNCAPTLEEAVTSIQEQTLTFVPKIISIFLAIMLLGHWMLNSMIDYMVRLWTDFTMYIR